MVEVRSLKFGREAQIIPEHKARSHRELFLSEVHFSKVLCYCPEYIHGELLVNLTGLSPGINTNNKLLGFTQSGRPVRFIGHDLHSHAVNCF